jgi:hypothetical protein
MINDRIEDILKRYVLAERLQNEIRELPPPRKGIEEKNRRKNKSYTQFIIILIVDD